MQMDVLPTADGTPVVFHDINMKRATGLDEDIRKVSRRCPCDSFRETLVARSKLLYCVCSTHTPDVQIGHSVCAGSH